MATVWRATPEDIYTVEGKAELVDGELKVMDGTGYLPSRASSNIYLRLRAYERARRTGVALGDNSVCLVDLPNRHSFSPDAAYFVGELTGMKFLKGAPIFAAEVRSENSYKASAEREIARKRADYFAAGTQVVWDVDLLGEDVVRVYRASDPEQPTVYRRGEVAEAEPALPGWRMPVDELFE